MSRRTPYSIHPVLQNHRTFKSRRAHRILCLLWLSLFIVAVPTLAGTDPDGATSLVVERNAAAFAAADGQNTGGTEYSADNRVDVAGSDFIEAQVSLKRFRTTGGEEQLRVYFAVHDNDSNASDRIDFVFDRLHDHESFSNPDDDVLVRVSRGDCSGGCDVTLFTRDGANLFSGTGTVEAIADAQVRAGVADEYNAADFPGGWSGELVLTPGDLGWAAFPPVVGFLVRARSGNNNGIDNGDGSGGLTPVASYPLSGGNVVSDTAADDWANLELRYPIDYALVLDFSGSMLGLDGLAENRWTRAKRAADLFVATLGLFRDQTCLGNASCIDDRLYASQYSWACSNDNPAGDSTGAIQGVPAGPTEPIPPPPTGNNSFTDGNNTDPAGGNCTPIRRGLEFALDDAGQLAYPCGLAAGSCAAAEDDRRDRIVLLLSDGFHNTPPGHIPFVPADDFGDGVKEFAQVRTVALGPDGSSGTDLLSDISTAFSGATAFEAKYNNANTFEELLAAYLESLQDPLTINVVDDDAPASPGGSYSPGAPDKLVFIGVWDDPNDASNLEIQREADPVINGTISNDRIGYAAVVVDQPTAGGAWTISDTADGVMPDQRFVLADLRILARFLAEQRRYGTGEPIDLTVLLNDLGAPLVGAEATVEVARPGEALGNFLATIQQDCDFDDPRLPDRPPFDVDVFGGSQGSPTVLPSASTVGGDPPPGRYGLAQSHFERCGLDGLEREELPGLPLSDRGDGSYTLSYADTGLEGTYTFRFHVRGTTSDGVDFTRTRTFSQYIRVKPTPEATDIRVFDTFVSGGYQNAQLYLLPRDGLGNYLGPGFANRFRVTLTSGELVGEMQDLADGVYLQSYRYPQGEPPPRIIIELPDGDEPKVIGGRQFELVLPYVGWFDLDRDLGLDDGLMVGLRLGWRLAPRVVFELEGGITFTETTGGLDGNVFQALANVRYELPSTFPAWQPYAVGGVGLLHFRGFGGSADDALTFHTGFGTVYRLSSNLGLLLEGRVFRTEAVLGAGETTSSQVNAGLVWRFD